VKSVFPCSLGSPCLDGWGNAPEGPSIRRLLLVEDEETTRDDVARALSGPPLNIAVTAAPDAETALKAIATGGDLDVALIDLGLPDQSGLEVIRALRRARPTCPPVVFTIYGDAESIFDALRAGACGYLLKQTPIERLHPALLDAMSGGAPMSPAIARLVVSSFADQQAQEHLLTRREREILTILARGHTYGDVAKALTINLGTVQGYVKSIYSKLEISSKAEAAVIAARLGLI
jgi:DNA-binding NarL/FixJ family response regulator